MQKPPTNVIEQTLGLSSQSMDTLPFAAGILTQVPLGKSRQGTIHRDCPCIVQEPNFALHRCTGRQDMGRPPVHRDNKLRHKVNPGLKQDNLRKGMILLEVGLAV